MILYLFPNHSFPCCFHFAAQGLESQLLQLLAVAGEGPYSSHLPTLPGHQKTQPHKTSSVLCKNEIKDFCGVKRIFDVHTAFFPIQFL